MKGEWDRAFLTRGPCGKLGEFSKKMSEEWRDLDAATKDCHPNWVSAFLNRFQVISGCAGEGLAQPFGHGATRVPPRTGGQQKSDEQTPSNHATGQHTFDLSRGFGPFVCEARAHT